MTNNTAQDYCDLSCNNSDGRKERPGDQSCSSMPSDGPNYRLFDRQRSIYQIMGGGKAADVFLWKQFRVSFGVIVVATFTWLLVERSGISFLSLSSDVLLILVAVQFVRAQVGRQHRPLPELVLSEEMVNNAAASIRVKVNNMLLLAHDITLGKDFRLFIKVVMFLWLMSVVGSVFSFFTVAYIGTIVAITVPALYNKYEEHVDKYAGFVHQKISKHYKIVDESVIRRLPKNFSQNKQA